MDPWAAACVLVAWGPASVSSDPSADSRDGQVAAAHTRPAVRSGALRLPVLALVVLTVVAYAPLLDNGFVNYDDGHYVTDSAITQRGLTWQGLHWALTDTSFNWHPVTRLSHMLDCELFGLDPVGHHLTSLLLHIGCSFALLLALWRMTGSVWRSWTVAALFAVHPTHVESVAWIAERKDVLSTFFWMAAVVAYVAFARRPGWWRMALVTVAVGLGLGAKQMLVTAPFTLLLLDVWPLGRLRLRAGAAAFRQDLRTVVLEKLPLFVLVAAGIWVAVLGQTANMMPLDRLPVAERVGNALTAAVGYLGKLLAPRDLVVFYPLPASTSLWLVGASAAVLAVLTVAALTTVRSAPYLAVGWFWYLGTLTPVIGIVQIGLQAMADRYTYVPSIGLFIAVVWGAADIVGRHGAGPRVVAAATVALLVVLCVLTRAQVKLWRDSVSLFEHAVATAPSDVAHLNLAEALRVRDDRAGAVRHYLAASAHNPENCAAAAGLASARVAWGQPAAALEPATRAVQLCPGDARLQLTLAIVLADLGHRDQAIPVLERTVALDPGLARAHWGLCLLLVESNQPARALASCRAAAAADPGNSEIRDLLAQVEERLRRPRLLSSTGGE